MSTLPTELTTLVYVVLAFDNEGVVHIISIHHRMDTAARQAETARDRYPTVRVGAAVLVD